MSHERYFQFKQFGIHHELSAMKVGVDGVMLGAWVNLKDIHTLLDVGCGCGLIAIMCAQRNSLLHATGIDIDVNSVTEARQNGLHSPWNDRLDFHVADFTNIPDDSKNRYDLIVSNPPFFHSGVTTPVTERELSRHAAALSPESLLQKCKAHLNPHGHLAMITPSEQLHSLINMADKHGMRAVRLTHVSTKEGKKPKRLLSEWMRQEEATDLIMTHINIESICDGQRQYSQQYIALCRDFYLHF